MSKAKKKPAARAKAKAAPEKKAKTKSAPKLKKPKVVARAKKKPAKSAPAPRVSPPKLQPDLTAPPPPVRAVNRPRRVSIGEALAQLNAATLEGVTAELTPFGLTTEVELTPNPGLASLIGAEPRPLSVLVSALEDWAQGRRASGAAAHFGRRAGDGELAAGDTVTTTPEATPATADESANMILVAELTTLFEQSPHARVELEGIVKRNCRL